MGENCRAPREGCQLAPLAEQRVRVRMQMPEVLCLGGKFTVILHKARALCRIFHFKQHQVLIDALAAQTATAPAPG